MPIVSSRSIERGTPTKSVPRGNSSTAMRGTTSPVVRTRKYPGHGLVFWHMVSRFGCIVQLMIDLMKDRYFCRPKNELACLVLINKYGLDGDLSSEGVASHGRQQRATDYI